MLHLKPDHQNQDINLNPDTQTETNTQTDTKKKDITTLSEYDTYMDYHDRSNWGNKLVVNTGDNPVINFAFMLRVEGVFDLPCKSVKGIRRENEFDYIQEGGLNDYVHLKRKAISKPFTFQVERYVGVNWVDPMPLGTELVLPLILFVNNRTFPTLKPVRNYVFTGCTVIAKDYGELNAEVSGLLVETVTIAYREMVCLDIPNDALSSGDVWQFKDKEKEGSGPRNYNSNFLNTDWESSYNSKEAMERRAVKWGPKDEKPKSSAKHNEGELSQKKMEENAALWDINGKSRYYISSQGKGGKPFSLNIKAVPSKSSAKHNAGELSEEKMIENAVLWDHKDETPESSAKHNDGELTKEQMLEKAVLWDHKDETPESSAKHNEGELTKEQMKEKAVLWDHKDETPESSAKHNEGELTKEQMKEKAVLWDHKDETPESSAKYNEGELTKEQMLDNAIQWDPKDNDPRYGKDNGPMVTPEPRLWPKKKSAKQITDFLSKH